MRDRLTCVTAPAPCVDLAAAKLHLDVESSHHDELIGDLIEAAQAVISGPRGIGYALSASTWRFSLDAFPTGMILIPLEPVTEIASIEYVDTAGVTQTLAPSDYMTALDRVIPKVAPAYGKAWPATRPQFGAVTITMEAGAPEAPRDLRNAVLLMLRAWYDDPAGMGTLPERANDILEQYRDRGL